jgi:hypothetical protein
MNSPKPSFWSRLGAFFTGKQANLDWTPRLIDAAATGDSRPHVSDQMLDMRRLVTDFDRRRIISVSRKLFSNLGPGKAPITQRSSYAFGKAWKPKFVGADKSWGEYASSWLREEFYYQSDVRGLPYDFATGLYLDSICIDVDGDIGIIFTQDETGYPKFQRVRAHRIGYRSDFGFVESGPLKGMPINQGVISDLRNRPLAYRVIQPSNLLYDLADGIQYRDYPTSSMVLLYDPEFSDQIRGLPVLTHAINDLIDLMHTQDFEKQAAMIASAIGLVEYNESGAPEDLQGLINQQIQVGDQEAQLVNPIQTQNFFGGMVKYFRSNSGGKLESISTERPGDGWDKLMNRLIRNACAGIPWPYELAWDPSALGGANIRMVLSQAERAVQDRQELIFPLARKQVSYACAKAIQLGIMPYSGDFMKWSFTFPPRVGVDYGREKAQDLADYFAGIQNLTSILESQGDTIEEHLEERAQEVVLRNEIAAKYGIDVDDMGSNPALISADAQMVKAESSNDPVTSTDNTGG